MSEKIFNFGMAMLFILIASLAIWIGYGMHRHMDYRDSMRAKCLQSGRADWECFSMFSGCGR